MAFITFTSDGNFHGYQMLSATPPSIGGTDSATGGGSVGRGGGSTGRDGGGVDRGGIGGGAQQTEIIFGFGPINGTWLTTSKGRIIGSLNELVQVTSVVTITSRVSTT